MAELQLGGKVIATQSGTNNPVLSSDVALNDANLGSAIFPNFVGMVAAFAMASPPTGWLACQGQTLDANTDTAYTALFNAIGTTWGGTGKTSFLLPDLRGAFLRGIGTGSINSRNKVGPTNVGDFQEDQFQSHGHNIRGDESGVGANPKLFNSAGGDNSGVIDIHEAQPAGDDGYFEHDSNGTPRHGSDTRPYNAGILYCIRWK